MLTRSTTNLQSEQIKQGASHDSEHSSISMLCRSHTNGTTPNETESTEHTHVNSPLITKDDYLAPGAPPLLGHDTCDISAAHQQTDKMTEISQISMRIQQQEQNRVHSILQEVDAASTMTSHANDETMQQLLLHAHEERHHSVQYPREDDFTKVTDSSLLSVTCEPTSTAMSTSVNVSVVTPPDCPISGSFRSMYSTTNTSAMVETQNTYHSVLKRKSIPLSMKKEAIEWISGPGKGIPSRAEKHFSALDWDVSASSFRKWWKNRDKIMRDASNKKRIAGGGRKPYLESTEERLLVAVIQERAKKDRVTRKWIAQTAQQMFQHSNSNFKASENWVTKFIRRNGLTLKRSYVTYPMDGTTGLEESVIVEDSSHHDQSEAEKMLMDQQSDHVFHDNTINAGSSSEALNSHLVLQHGQPSDSATSVDVMIPDDNINDIQGRAVV
uniref:Uncharacterized protein AlNc14C396G11329 n=1 Tax=Albugo laibachii Nc14 TaxID=890382 RepID=F0WYR8_9STRA|nr:conserved hypothetical protein [Albugo laibachii Nc14]|eukprot:CCA26627.1 conserved hypothetical protein [Albugo laibachii Nc14]